MPRGPVFSPPPLGPRGSKKGTPPIKAFAGPRGECEGCRRDDGRVRCTCVVQDRCSSTDDGGGGQCILGAGHGLRHVNAVGKHWS